MSTDLDARPGSGPATHEPSWPLAALTGLATGVLALGVAQLVAAVVAPSSAPVVAVGRAFIDATPLWLKEFAVSAFGLHDKQVLLGGAGLVVVLLAGLAGVLARRRLQVALVLIIALGAVASLAAFTRPDATVLSVLPSIVGVGLGAIVLQRFAVMWAEPADAGLYGGAARRSVLLGAGAVGAAGAASGAVGWLLGGRLRGADESREAVRLPAPASPEPPLPAGVSVGVDGVVPFRVANADFYRIDTALVVPRLRTQDWSLRIHGMVGREVTLTWDELLAADLIERDITLMCVSNEVGGNLVGNARWLGMRIAPLLARAAPSADADMVLCTSDDGWNCSTPLEALTDDRDAMLAVGMNGDPLPVEHGFPVRLVVPGLYGYVSATKWVTDLEVTRFDRVDAYWTTRGWSAKGPIKTASRIDVPGDKATVDAGRRPIAGVAWAQHRGITAVEVSVDDGPWVQARLGDQLSIDTWRQWVLPWDATPGDHRIQVRAVDGTGALQSNSGAAPAPDGSTGWQRIRVTVQA